MPVMKKKKRNSILRRPDSADEAGSEGTVGTMEKAAALPDYDKENQVTQKIKKQKFALEKSRLTTIQHVP